MEALLLWGALIFGGLFLMWRGAVKQRNEAREQMVAANRLRSSEANRFEEKIANNNETIANLNNELRQANERFASAETVLAETATFYPTLSHAIAQHESIYLKNVESQLRTKKRPAIRKAEEANAVFKEYRASMREHTITSHRLRYYEHHYPFITELDGLTLDEILRHHRDQLEQQIFGTGEGHTKDEASKWLSKEEWADLSSAERSQTALDRYMDSRKSNAQIGRDYERYCGYLFEEKGYRVQYFGIEEGFEDLGRDLIVKQGKHTIIVQCKNWASHKTIHEKHIFQLYGTFMEYKFRNGIAPDDDANLTALFMTSTTLSDKAREFADFLGVKVRQELKFDRAYPMIKCNVGRDGNRIYHLPFDQQYDRTIIEPEKGEEYVATAIQAEELGFRRASRWFASAE